LECFLICYDILKIIDSHISASTLYDDYDINEKQIPLANSRLLNLLLTSVYILMLSYYRGQDKGKHHYTILSAITIWAMVSGTIKRQKRHFVHVESTTNFIERESQKHMYLRNPLIYFNLI
jgi:hypothetical protein